MNVTRETERGHELRDPSEDGDGEGSRQADEGVANAGDQRRWRSG